MDVESADGMSGTLASVALPDGGSRISDQLPLSLTAVVAVAAVVAVVAVEEAPASRPGCVDTSRHAFPTRWRSSSAAKQGLLLPEAPGRSYMQKLGTGRQCKGISEYHHSPMKKMGTAV